MPYRLQRLKGGKVRAYAGGRVVAKRTSMAKAKRQQRLLRAVDHGWRPSR